MQPTLLMEEGTERRRRI